MIQRIVNVLKNNKINQFLSLCYRVSHLRAPFILHPLRKVSTHRLLPVSTVGVQSRQDARVTAVMFLLL